MTIDKNDAAGPHIEALTDHLGTTPKALGELGRASERATEALKALEALLPPKGSDLRGPSPTPPGATRHPKKPGITIAPPTNKRKAARAARRKNR